MVESVPVPSDFLMSSDRGKTLSRVSACLVSGALLVGLSVAASVGEPENVGSSVSPDAAALLVEKNEDARIVRLEEGKTLKLWVEGKRRKVTEKRKCVGKWHSCTSNLVIGGKKLKPGMKSVWTSGEYWQSAIQVSKKNSLFIAVEGSESGVFGVSVYRYKGKKLVKVNDFDKYQRKTKWAGAHYEVVSPKLGYFTFRFVDGDDRVVKTLKLKYSKGKLRKV
jgi:hypothetical protein